MATPKYYNSTTGQWEAVLAGPRGATGPKGDKGDTGDAGPGVAAGGAAGQILGKKSGTNFDTEWIDKPTSGVWGQITGTLSNQTDLTGALNGKVDKTALTNALPTTLGTNGQILKSTGTALTWQEDDGTAYSEITDAEITAGTASTARAISGRRAQTIVDKARAGVVKSATTDRLTVSDTAPASPQNGDIWYDTSEGTETSLFSQFMDKVYPVGSLYFNADNDTNPGTLLGVGEWTAYAQGRVPVGKAISGTFSRAGGTMGAETHTLTEAQLPNISGTFADFALQDSNQAAVAVSGVFSSYQAGGYQGIGTSSAGTRRDGVSMNFGANQPHNNIQPSIVVYIWRRIS